MEEFLLKRNGNCSIIILHLINLMKIDITKTKSLVENYFADIPPGAPIVKSAYVEEPITKELIDTTYDSNIQIPAIMAGYRIPGITSDDNTAKSYIVISDSNGVLYVYSE